MTRCARSLTLAALMGMLASLAAVTSTSAQPAPGATDKQALLDIAAKTKGPAAAACLAGGGFMNMAAANGGFTVIVEGPLGRVARALTEAKKMYKPFTVEHITDDMAAAVVTVSTFPDKPVFGPTHLSYSKYDDGAPTWHQAPLAKHLVLKTRPKKGGTLEVLQPTDVALVPFTWSNAAGGSFTGQGVTATFDLDAVRAFALEDVDVAIVSDLEQERTCKIGKSDLAKVK